MARLQVDFGLTSGQFRRDFGGRSSSNGLPRRGAKIVVRRAFTVSEWVNVDENLLDFPMTVDIVLDSGSVKAVATGMRGSVNKHKHDDGDESFRRRSR